MLKKINKQEFWQSKYEYYRTILIWVVVASALSSVLYYFSDCYLMGGFQIATLIPRLAILVPLTAFIYVVRKYNSFKIVVPMAYIVAHGVMWCTIWSCTKLSNLDFAAEGFVIINYVFLAMGIATPIHIGIIAHGFLLVDIIIANTFIHYPEFDMMLLLGIPSFLGICAYNIAVERSFKDRYLLQAKLEECLTLDSLTGAYNRKIMTSLVDEQRHFISKQNDLTIIMFDIDYFKRINDNYGHDIGDNVLVSISKIIGKMLKEDDKLIRWGGEEFIIVSYDNIENSIKLAEKIRLAVENEKLEIPEVTISAGVAAYEGTNYEIAIKHADEALYIAKNQGRNKVVKYENAH